MLVKLWSSRLALLLALSAGVVQARGAQHPPVIDVHLHAEKLDSYIAVQADKRWFPAGYARPSSDAELRDQTFAALRQFNVVRAITSDEFDNVQRWRAVDPQRIVPALMGRFYSEEAKRNIRARVQSGDVVVLGEVTWQYDGHSPSDPINESFWALAEELDIPVGIHMGLTPAGWSQTVNTNIRARLGSPLLLEDALIKHPKVRVYIMHAGWPLLDETIAMLQAYPTLYVDVAWIDWYLPRAEFYTYLRRLVEAGFGTRIMFGSDQMQWPQAIGAGIESIESAPFVTAAQKRDILCRNAMRFFRFDASICQ